MIQITYFLCLLLTFILLRCLQIRGKTLRHPLVPRQTIRVSGQELCFIVLFATGLMAFSAPAGLDLMALRLLLLEFLCLLLLGLSCYRAVWTLPSVLYTAYLAWLVIGLFYSPAPSYGVRVISKYIYALLIILAASAIVRSPHVAITALIWSRRVAVFSLFAYFLPYVGRYVLPGVFWYVTAAAIHYIFIITLSLALYVFNGHRKGDLALAILFALPCIVWVFRTSIMGSTLALMLFLFFRYKVKALPFMFGALVLFICAVFFIPSVKEKMFFDKGSASISDVQSGHISFDNINSNGRFAMWEWSLDRFYDPKPLTGSGTGNLQETFYSLRHPFGTIRICHNDYVQMLCDNGLIGLILFGASFLSLIFHCFLVYSNRRHTPMARLCALVAGPSLAGTMLTMYTDNVINYTMATLSFPCATYGMMLGLLHAERKQRHAV